MQLLECVANVSEGRDPEALDALGSACGDALLDYHADPDHNRSVLTIGGTRSVVDQAIRALARTAVGRLDLSVHEGRHPRFGVLDVVPFVPLAPAPDVTALGRSARSPGRGTALTPAVDARDAFARWAAVELGLPCFLYGPPGPGHGTPAPGRGPLASGGRSLPEVRRGAFDRFLPDTGPPTPHPAAGATAVGAREVLVAYNLWVAGGDITLARSVAAALRRPAVRALAFDLASGIQVSCNLVEPLSVGPAEVHDDVAHRLETHGAHVERCELVGLVPAAVLDRVPARRWKELDLDPGATIEARLEARGVS